MPIIPGSDQEDEGLGHPRQKGRPQLNKPSKVMHTCDPSYMEGITGRMMAWGFPLAKKRPHEGPIWKITKAKSAGGMTQVVEGLASKLQGPKFKPQYCPCSPQKLSWACYTYAGNIESSQPSWKYNHSNSVAGLMTKGVTTDTRSSLETRVGQKRGKWGLVQS
jgi:hypothetical protein